MARDFNGSSDKLVNGNPSSMQLTNNFTVHTWMDNDTACGIQRVAGFVNDSGGGSDDGFSWGISGTALFMTSFGVKDYTTASCKVSTNTLLNYLIILDSCNDAEFFLDGASIETVTHTSPANVNTGDNYHIGANGTIEFWNGLAAESAVWNVALSTDEITSLANGVNPFIIRNSALVFYSPIYGNNSPESEYVGSNTLTVTGTVKIKHPPVELLENYL